MDQTQITKAASWPALTSLELDRGWIRTHNCGVAFLGFGLGELGFGLGVVEALALGVVEELGLGVVVSGLAVPSLEGEDPAAELDVVGLDDGVSLADVREDADVFREADVLVLLADLPGVADSLADLAGVADELADLNGVAEELASAVARSWFAALFLAPESTVLFGISGHAELMPP